MEKLARIGVIALVIAVTGGCTWGPRFLHPKQLWKWNQGEAWDEGPFSVPDPVDARLTRFPATDPAAAPNGDSATP